MDVEILIVDGQLLHFDLLFGIAMIKVLGGVHRTESSEACFGNLNRCATISINEPNLSVMFNQNKKVWTVSWKWVSGHSPSNLMNSVHDYSVLDHAWDAYEKELLL